MSSDRQLNYVNNLQNRDQNLYYIDDASELNSINLEENDKIYAINDNKLFQMEIVDQEEELSGSIVSFNGRNNTKIKSLVANIEPVQDLHGYDHPWPAGGGKNLYAPPAVAVTSNGVKLTPNEDESITLSGQANSVAALFYSPVDIPSGTTVTISLNNTAINAEVGVRLLSTASAGSGTQYGTMVSADTVNKKLTFTTTFAAKSINVFVKTNHGAVNNITLKVMVELGSTSSVFEPYKNICPISGQMGAVISYSGADTSDPDTISVNWQNTAGTVYGGTLDVISGVLTVDRETFSLDGTTTISTISEMTNVIRFWIYTNEKFRLPREPNVSKIKSDRLLLTTYATDAPGFGVADAYVSSLVIKLPKGTCEATVEGIRAYLQANPLQFVLPLANPVTYQLMPQEVTTLLGTNNIWTDIGDITVKIAEKGITAFELEPHI